MIKNFTLLLVLCSFISVKAQYKITGTIKDQSGEPIAFSSVYVKSTTKATSANANGDFLLPIEKGPHTLVFKAIGFKSLEKNITVETDMVVNASLADEAFLIKDVIISGAEDPAYEIIRKTIKKRKDYLEEVDQFSCDVYIKGMQKLLAAPKKFLGQDISKMGREIGLDSNRQGIVYLSESESKYSFARPNKIHEEMISSKVSGSNRAFSFNRASEVQVNFYENFQNWEGLSLRPLISPIADNAMFYYRYKYMGVTTENGNTVFKIQVIPRRETDPVFRGYIYILEDAWRLYNVDLMLTKESNLNLIDTLEIKQQFIPVSKDVWMPSSMTFNFKGGLLGFRFGGYFLAISKNYDITTKKSAKTFAEVMRITREVNKKDADYWENARPVPLTEEEKMDYSKKAVLALKRESKSYLDSLDKENNKFKPFKFIMRGYSVRNRYKKEYYHFSSLKDALFFNTVEGYGVNYGFNYRKQIDSLTNKYLTINGKLRYGFSSEKLYPALGISFPVGNYTMGVYAGGDVIDLNNQAYQNQLGNSFGSLWYQTNRLKLYEKKYAQINFSGRVYQGLTGNVFAEFSNRKALQNTNYAYWRKSKSNDYTSNNPFDPVNDALLFQENQAFKIGLRLSYNFSNKYVTYPTGKYYVSSEYPRLSVGYTKGINKLFGSDVDFDLIYAELAKNDIPMGFYGKSSFMIGAGTFLNNNALNYTDYKHFTGNVETFFTDKNNLFLFLDNYRHSTTKNYVELHASHNFSGFLLNKIPLIRKLKFQEIIGFNYLKTPEYKGYSELYFGLNYLNFKAYYGFVFPSDQQHADLHKSQGFRLSVGF